MLRSILSIKSNICRSEMEAKLRGKSPADRLGERAISRQPCAGLEKLTKPKKTYLQVPSDLKSLEDVLSWFDRLLHGTIDNATWMECKTALAEGWTNAVRYGNKGLPPDTPSDIEVAIFPESIEIRIFDQGPPGFDLDSKLEELRSKNNLEDPPPGGRGLLLMDRIADKLSYTRTVDNRNCLLLVKHCQIFQEGTDVDCP